MDIRKKLIIFLSAPTGLRPRILLGLFLIVTILASLYLTSKINNLSFTANTENDILTDYSKEQALIAEEESPNEETATTPKKSSSSSSSTADTSENSSPTAANDETSSPDDDSEPDTPTFVAYYADNQSDSDEDDVRHLSVVNKILATSANPVFHAGDIMEDGTLDSWNRFLNIADPLLSTKTFYAALGNNDRVVGDSTTPSPYFLDYFNFPGNEQWYSVDYGNLHMVILDSAYSASSPSQLSWLASDLQNAESQNKVTGVMYHHPTFASTVSSYLNSYGADFVIAGHIHTYTKLESSGVYYFTLPGGTSIGYALANIYSNSVNITFYNNSGGVIENSSFSAR